MAVEKFISRRMLMRSQSSREHVYRYLVEMGWSMVLEEGDASRRENYRADFRVAPGTLFHYVEDFVSRQSYFYVSSVTELGVERLATLVDDDLDPFGLSELLEISDNARGLEHGRAIVKLGVAAPHEFDEQVFARIDSGMRNEDLRVRRLSLWATVYSPWPQYLPQIRFISEHDPDDGIRGRAMDILEVFESQGVIDG